jgi:hypothetical protein
MSTASLHPRRRFEVGALITEAVVALAILAVALLPLTYVFASETKLFRAYLHRAVVMEILDGELEVLAAGEWRAFDPGEHAYRVRADAATNLPPGKFVLTRTQDRLRLAWAPGDRGKQGGFLREVRLP